MDKASIKDQILRHEGEVLHAYEDSLGVLTIGVGRMIDKRRNGGISHEEAMHLLDNDIARVVSELEGKMPRLYRYPERVQTALTDMAFQLGIAGLMKFRKMIAALEAGDYRTAADEALNSRWANQTPSRANEIARMIRGE